MSVLLLSVGLRCSAGQGQRESGTFTGHRRHRQFSLHQLCQSPGQCQPQACAAMFTADLCAALAEFLKNQLVQMFRDSGAGVDHVEAQLRTLRLHLQPNFALLGELERIGQQVVQNLLEPQAVANEHFRGLVGDRNGQCQPFLCR